MIPAVLAGNGSEEEDIRRDDPLQRAGAAYGFLISELPVRAYSVIAYRFPEMEGSC
jgi:hypothetical protein